MKTSLFSLLFSSIFFSTKRFSSKKERTQGKKKKTKTFSTFLLKVLSQSEILQVNKCQFESSARKGQDIFSCLLYFYFLLKLFLLLTTYSVILFFQNRVPFEKFRFATFSPQLALLPPASLPSQFLVQEIRGSNGRMQVSTSIKYLNIFQGLQC